MRKKTRWGRLKNSQVGSDRSCPASTGSVMRQTDPEAPAHRSRSPGGGKKVGMARGVLENEEEEDNPGGKEKNEGGESLKRPWGCSKIETRGKRRPLAGHRHPGPPAFFVRSGPAGMSNRVMGQGFSSPAAGPGQIRRSIPGGSRVPCGIAALESRRRMFRVFGARGNRNQAEQGRVSAKDGCGSQGGGLSKTREALANVRPECCVK